MNLEFDFEFSKMCIKVCKILQMGQNFTITWIVPKVRIFMFLYEFKVQKTSLLMKNFSLCRAYKKVKHTICENESNNRLNLIIKTSESLILVYYDKVFLCWALITYFV